MYLSCKVKVVYRYLHSVFIIKSIIFNIKNKTKILLYLTMVKGTMNWTMLQCRITEYGKSFQALVFKGLFSKLSEQNMCTKRVNDVYL